MAVDAIADWVFLISGGVLALAGLALLYFALLHDRSRGRRRCPKCWYDMSASPGRICSECGYAAKRDSKLHKTRRRWRRAFLAVCVLALAGGVAAVPKIKRDGWIGSVPTTLLILAWPEIEQHVPEAREELAGRLRENKAWAWQWRWLLSKTESGAAPHLDATFVTRDRWPEGVPVHCMVSLTPAQQLREWGLEVPMRVQLVSPFDPHAQPAQLHIASSLFPAFPMWQPPHQEARLGIPPAGAKRIEVDLVLQLKRKEKWQRIYRRQMSFDLDVGGALEEHIALDVAPETGRNFRHLLFFDLRGTHLAVRRPFLESPRAKWPVDVCAPVTIELRRDGEFVASWETWLTEKPQELSGRTWWGDRPIRGTIGEFRLPAELKGGQRPFGTMDYDRFTWSVHVRGDPGRALLDKNAPVAWAGEFEVPLLLLNHPTISAYQSRIGEAE